jgi:hypothetical protein
MNITPPNDSTALAHLINPAEIRLALSRPIPKVEQTGKIKAINEEDKNQQKQQQERRRKERRQRREASILDTRSTQERRSILGQEADTDPKGQGIDVMA